MAGGVVGGLTAAVRAGDRAAVAKAITMVESTHPRHRSQAREFLVELTADLAGRPLVSRVAISGVPGVGKSTFIESLGMSLIEAGHRVGVLTVDPSSVRTGGSVLGDKTRMLRLATNSAAYIRPSPSAGTLGGVARATAAAITVLEAAGFDVVLVETVGVGQSEIAVASMVDTFVLLTLARTGDQLQGLKKGILEIADVIAVNKADDRDSETRAAARDLAGALRLVHGPHQWRPPVLTCSGLTGAGVDTVWAQVQRHRDALGLDGLASKRADQRWDLTKTLVRDELDHRLNHLPDLQATRTAVRIGHLDPGTAADHLLTTLIKTNPPE